LASYQGIALVGTLFICKRQAWFTFGNFLGLGQLSIFSGFLRLALISLVSAFCVPVAHIFIREIINSQLGIDAAGIWDATWRLSAAFLLFITSALVVYVLPKFSSITDDGMLWKEFLGISKKALMLAAGIAVFVYLARGLIVPLLFTTDFAPVTDLLFWQLVGDVLKVFGWLLSYAAISRLYYGVCIFSEIFYNALFVFFVHVLVSRFGLNGAVYAHCLSYIFYTGLMYLLVRRRLLKGQSSER
jgi:PST family polysaccharide transporter